MDGGGGEENGGGNGTSQVPRGIKLGGLLQTLLRATRHFFFPDVGMDGSR